MISRTVKFTHHSLMMKVIKTYSLRIINWIALEHRYMLSLDNQVACMTKLTAERIRSDVIHPTNVSTNAMINLPVIGCHTGGLHFQISVDLTLSASFPASCKASILPFLSVFLPLLKAVAQPTCSWNIASTLCQTSAQSWRGWTGTIEMLVNFQLYVFVWTFTIMFRKNDLSEWLELLLPEYNRLG